MHVFQRAQLLLCLFSGICLSGTRNNALVIDHAYDLSLLSSTVRTRIAARAPIVHYAHRSDGSAVPFGLAALAESDPTSYPYHAGVIGSDTTGLRGLRLWDGMPSGDYVYPSGYWASASAREELGTLLATHPEIEITTWTWCNEDDYWSATGDSTGSDNAQAYFHWMDSLEKAYPKVTFVYQTAAMRDPGSEDAMQNQAAFNDSVRTWAVRRNKILFDFADLDAWHAGAEYTIVANGDTIPFQNPAWLADNGTTNNGHHANDSMGIDKGRAWWTLMARLEIERMAATSIDARKERSVSWTRTRTSRGWRWTEASGKELEVGLYDFSGRLLAHARERGSVELVAPSSQTLLVARVGDGATVSSEILTLRNHVVPTSAKHP